MKFLIIFFFTLLATMVNIVAAADHEYSDDYKQELEMQSEPTSLRGVLSRRLVAQQNLLANVTCDKFPRVCRMKKGLAGLDCCKKKCVDVKTNRANCGKCGNKCKYTEICCRGQCVNASFDKRHCGGCNNKCKKGEFCVYGMCNYA